MTLHEQRVEYLLQNIALELSDLVFEVQKSNSDLQTAKVNHDYYSRNIRDVSESLLAQIDREDHPHGIKKLVRWVKLKFLV